MRLISKAGEASTRAAALLVTFTFVVTCGGGVTLAEYAEDVEQLVAAMNARLDELDAQLGGTTDLEAINVYASERVAARFAFLDGMGELEPPEEAEDLHDAALEIMGRLASAEASLADRVAEMESAVAVQDIWDTPEGVAARAADAEAIELCLVAQSNLDETEAREAFEGVAWVPAEMKEVVVVAFGCLPEDR